MSLPEIPYGRHDIDEHDVEAVVSVLRSDRVTQGPAVPRFEAAIAAYCQAQHAVAVNSGTSALHLACLALDLGPGDWLWTSPNSFVASANCGRACGASVDFVEIDPRTYNMSVEALAMKLEQAARHGRLPKVVVPVHFAGQSCDMSGIHSLARRYGFCVIEDASHALGGRFGGSPIGTCRYSDITVFSFHPVKLITTGEGGAAVTNNSILARRMTRLRSHGITHDRCESGQGSDGPWSYWQMELGFNYRMTDIQAALGESQLQRLEGFVARRQTLAARYGGMLAGLPLVTPWILPDVSSSTHLYVVQVEAPHNRRQVFERLRRSGIGVGVHYIPVHTQPYYQALGFARGDFPGAERYYDRAISLPIFASMTDLEQARCVEAVKAALTDGDACDA